MPNRLANGCTERYGVILDVTARREAEEAHRRTEERNRLIVDLRGCQGRRSPTRAPRAEAGRGV